MRNMIFFALMCLIFPVSVFAADMDWTPILTWLESLAPWVKYILMGLGSITAIGTFIDGLIPATSKEAGFMNKILAIPVLGSLLKALTSFSPFNTKQP